MERAPDGPAPPPRPHFRTAELALFDRFAVRGAGHYLEYGLGGSTLRALARGAGRLVAVDSDPAWVDRIRAEPAVAPRIADGSLVLRHADIGPLRDWGFPADRSASARWAGYVTAGWEPWRGWGAAPDTILVDGRFRVACLLYSALMLDFAGRAEDAILMLHDRSPDRPHYEAALAHFSILEEAATMVVLRMARPVRRAAMLETLAAHLADPR
ncbi:hypothetical protein [Neoroseomonas rubea]|uniref:hypothetical protein n=1 Tax=Neoroseomonas rubea TaxID=2748666 RepID=UPI0018DF229A|nr:hypothetical protein [Roseomonas rubea]